MRGYTDESAMAEAKKGDRIRRALCAESVVWSEAEPTTSSMTGDWRKLG